MSISLRFNGFAGWALWIGCLMIGGHWPAMGQVLQEASLEIEKERYGDFYFVIPAQQHGVFIFRETDDTEKEGVVWDMRTYDTDLDEVWSEKLIVDWKYNFRAYECIGGAFYMIFSKGNDGRSDFRIERIQLSTGERITYDIENDIDLELSHLTVSGNTMILGGYIVGRPAVMLYDFGGEKEKGFAGLFSAQK